MAVDRAASINGVVERSFFLLQAVAAADEPVGVRELARRTGLARSTVSRLLTTLEGLGMIERTADGLSRPGTALATLVPTGGLPPLWRDQLRSLLGELVDRFGESAALAVDDGEAVLYLSQISSGSAVQVPNVSAERHPFHLVAPGLALMAEWSDDRVDDYLAGPLAKATDHSVVEPVQLRSRIEQIRRDGYIWAEEELDDEVNGLACVVTRRDGRSAAVSIYGPAYRLSPGVRPGLAAEFCALVRSRAVVLL